MTKWFTLTQKTVLFHSLSQHFSINILSMFSLEVYNIKSHNMLIVHSNKTNTQINDLWFIFRHNVQLKYNYTIHLKQIVHLVCIVTFVLNSLKCNVFVINNVQNVLILAAFLVSFPSKVFKLLKYLWQNEERIMRCFPFCLQ